MKENTLKRKWTHIDFIVGTPVSGSPGIYQIVHLPSPLCNREGLLFAYSSSYSAIQFVRPGLGVVGELVGGWVYGGTTKAYNWALAGSSGQMYLNGPYKDFPEHHMTANQSFEIKGLFGHIPFPTRSPYFLIGA